MTIRITNFLALSLLVACRWPEPAVAEEAKRADVLTAHADRQRTGWFLQGTYAHSCHARRGAVRQAVGVP